MREFPFLATWRWPLRDFSGSTLYEHFAETKYSIYYPELFILHERETFLKALNSKPEFIEFWKTVQKEHPDKKNYFLTLTNEEEPFERNWILDKYNAYLVRKEFEGLSEESEREIKDDFDSTRPDALQAAFEGEARRLNCDVSEVRPTSLVPPWKSDNDEESSLVTLPDEIFGKILSNLNTIDVFRLTLVSRRLKNIIQSNSKHLKRAEHAATTHIITFRDWMDPLKSPSSEAFFRQYQLFSWCLTKWYCGLSENLETLILDHPAPYRYLVTLLESCPNLKRLQIANDKDFKISGDELIAPTVHLRHLEVFLQSNWHLRYDSDGTSTIYRHLCRDVLISAESLRAFRGLLDLEACSLINVEKPMSKVFSNLIALDLRSFTTAAIEILAQIENWQLRYLRFGDYESCLYMDGGYNEERTRHAFHQLLPKLDRLETLILEGEFGITNGTLQLITNLELNLSFAVLIQETFDDFSNFLLDDGSITSIEIDPLQPDVLTAFQHMLLSNNPTIDLSSIHFGGMKRKTGDSLEAAETGFTFLRNINPDLEVLPSSELYQPQMLKRLGIDF